MHLTRNSVKKLKRAIEKNDKDVVRAALSKNPEIAKSLQLGTEESLFWQAMYSGSEEIVELFIDHGADVNENNQVFRKTASEKSITFLQYLAYIEDRWQKRMKVAEILIRRGADINSIDNESRTILQTAILKGNLEYAKFLLKNGAKLEWKRYETMNLVFQAPKIMQSETLLLLIRYGLDVNVVNEDDNNTLHLTLRIARAKDIDVVRIAEILLNYGVPVDGLDNFGHPAMHYAIMLRNIELLSLLIEKGANINPESESGQQVFPLYIAASNNYTEIIDLFLSNGAKINHQNSIGWTALHGACHSKGNENLIKLLIQKGAHISSECKSGDTPFSFLKPQEYNEINRPSIHIMIKEMAKQKFADNRAVCQKDLDLIQSHPIVRELFQSCTQELFKLASTKFYAPFTYYSVIDMSKKNFRKLSHLTNNEEFVSNFQKNLNKIYHYSDDLRSILEDAMYTRNEFIFVESWLKTTFRGYLPDTVIRILAVKLRYEDVKLDP